ncbi:UNVERIFIED_ORG: hypothetical protein B2H98_08070 [Clostridium botulinum]
MKNMNDLTIDEIIEIFSYANEKPKVKKDMCIYLKGLLINFDHLKLDSTYNLLHIYFMDISIGVICINQYYLKFHHLDEDSIFYTIAEKPNIYNENINKHKYMCNLINKIRNLFIKIVDR